MSQRARTIAGGAVYASGGSRHCYRCDLLRVGDQGIPIAVPGLLQVAANDRLTHRQAQSSWPARMYSSRTRHSGPSDVMRRLRRGLKKSVCAKVNDRSVEVDRLFQVQWSDLDAAFEDDISSE